MRIVKPSARILCPDPQGLDGIRILKHLERCGRVCYQSNHKVEPGSYAKFAKMILKNGHESVLEHYSVSAVFICDRGVSHEIVRHRLASYSQESTRYCNYGNIDGEVSFILPYWWDDPMSPGANDWYNGCRDSEKAYLAILEQGGTPQEARSVLPNSTKTEIIMTANIREWRHFFKLRTAKAAHPQMREVAIPLLEEFRQDIPYLFDDITPDGYKAVILDEKVPTDFRFLKFEKID